MNSAFVDYELYSEIKELKERIAELEQVADNQIWPSMGDGFSGDYVIGYTVACADISKKLKDRDE